MLKDRAVLCYYLLFCCFGGDGGGSLEREGMRRKRCGDKMERVAG